MAKETKTIDVCPNCGSKHVNKLDWSGYFCMDCDCEIDKNGKLFSITYSGELVDYHVSELAKDAKFHADLKMAYEDCGEEERSFAELFVAVSYEADNLILKNELEG